MVQFGVQEAFQIQLISICPTRIRSNPWEEQIFLLLSTRQLMGNIFALIALEVQELTTEEMELLHLAIPMLFLQEGSKIQLTLIQEEENLILQPTPMVLQSLS